MFLKRKLDNKCYNFNNIESIATNIVHRNHFLCIPGPRFSFSGCIFCSFCDFGCFANMLEHWYFWGWFQIHNSRVPKGNHREFWSCKNFHSIWLTPESRTDDCWKADGNINPLPWCPWPAVGGGFVCEVVQKHSLKELFFGIAQWNVSETWHG